MVAFKERLTAVRNNKAIKDGIMIIAVLIAYLYLSGTAIAQSASDLPTYDQINAAAGSSSGGSADVSRAILSKLLGPFADNPFTPGAANTLLGGIFFFFNAVLFVVGAAFIGYNTMMAIAVTAHEGEALGKRMNGLWIPIRFTTGVFGMVPVFSGFSLAQAIMMIFVTLGIGMANLMTTSAINSLDDFQSIIPTPIQTTGTSNNAASQQAVDALFLMHVCTEASKDYSSFLSRGLQTFWSPEVIHEDDGIVSKGAGLDCGNIKVEKNYRTSNSDVANFIGIGGYRNTAVDYQTINSVAEPIRLAEIATLKNMSTAIRPIALNWYTKTRGDGNNTEFPEYPHSELNSVLSSAISTEDEAIKSAFGVTSATGAVTSTAKSNMSKGGWLSIGAWYATFAEANSALQSASSSIEVIVKDPSLRDADLPKSMANMFRQMATKKDMVDKCFWVVDKNPTGNCAPGQNLIMYVLNSMAKGTGGGSGDSALVNPIFLSKNIGDVMLNLAAALWATKQVISQKKETNSDKQESILKNIVGKTPGGVFLKILGKAAGYLLNGILQFGFFALGAIFVIGLMYGVYIPFIPFLTWFSGLVTYFASVIEGLVAAQVWAFSHLHTEGEGMGQQTSRGYLYVLNMILRPGLMVLGFFFASAIVVLLGTIFFQLFGAALANVQGDTMTGLLIQFGVLCIVMITLLGLVQTTFNLIFEIPDRVMSWFGSGMDARIGREMSGEIKAEKKSAAQWVGRTADISSKSSD